MAKFKVGDKVKDTRTGRVGTIILDNPASLSFTVDWGGAQTNVPKGYEYLVAANSRAINTKFKVGDKVRVTGSLRVFTVKDTRESDGQTSYMVESEGYPTHWQLEKYIRSANSRICNSSKVWVIKTSNGYFRVPGVPTYTPKVELATHYISESAAKEDAKRRLATSIEWQVVQEISNSRVCNSSNPVVRKALNAVARNEITYFDKKGDDVRVGDKVTYMGRVHKVVAIKDEGGGELYARLDGVPRPVKHYDIIKT